MVVVWYKFGLPKGSCQKCSFWTADYARKAWFMLDAEGRTSRADMERKAGLGGCSFIAKSLNSSFSRALMVTSDVNIVCFA